MTSFIASHPGGMITRQGLAELIARDPMRSVLVRSGSFRLICQVRDVEEIEKCLTAGGCHVRDVFILADDYRRAMQAESADRP